MSNRKVLKEGTRVYIGNKHAVDLSYTSIAGKVGTVTGHHYLSTPPFYFPPGIPMPALVYHVRVVDDGYTKEYDWNVQAEDVHLHRPETLGNYSNEDVLCILEDKEPF